MKKLSFKQYLSEQNYTEDKDFLIFQDAVFEEMKRMGITGNDWGIALQSFIREAYEEGASIEEIVQQIAKYEFDE